MLIKGKCHVTNHPQRGAFVSEPAIMVKRPTRPGQVWSMEKLDNKLVDMRDMYSEWRRRRESNESPEREEVSPTEENEDTGEVSALSW